jgi:hypothetical protein
MIYSNRVDNFYLTPGQLAASPSRADGIDEATERELRHYCCDITAEAAVLLRLPQVVAATAQVLVQRFYCKRSLKKFDVKVGAGACSHPAARDGSQPAAASLLPHSVRPFPLNPAPPPTNLLLPACLGAAAGRVGGGLLAGLQAGGGDRD